MTSAIEFELGTGVYSLKDAAQIINRGAGHASEKQVRFWIREDLSKSKSVGGNKLLSFEDLVSLEMISRFRSTGISLQAVRVAERNLRRRYPDLLRPLANLVFYTDGTKIWTLVGEKDDPDVLEIFGKVDQLAWKDAIETFATRIEFNNGRVSSWRPNDWVEINPRVQFGEPVVQGTRVTVHTVMANLEVGTPKEVADWYGLTEEQVLGARSYINNNAA
jgi:uncharacterized protein (DUF433 family)